MQDSNSAGFDENSHEVERQDATPQLVVEGADTFNYAAWQNAVPLLRSVTIENKQGKEPDASRTLGGLGDLG